MLKSSCFKVLRWSAKHSVWLGKCVPPSLRPLQLATLASPGDLVERQLLGLNSRLKESETLEVGPSSLWLKQAHSGILISTKFWRALQQMLLVSDPLVGVHGLKASPGAPWSSESFTECQGQTESQKWKKESVQDLSGRRGAIPHPAK